MTAPLSLRRLLPLHALRRWLLLLCALRAAVGWGFDAQAAERRFALVIGNSAYLEGPLKNPVNDARDIRAKLLELGFAASDIVYRENLRRDQIGSTLREFRAKLQADQGAVAMVFYAGHGVQFKGENYFPAVDARLEGEEDTPLHSLQLRQLMDVLADSRTRLNLVFLDACRNNPFARSFRSGTRGLGRTADALPSGTLIAYATSANSVAADGSGRNAPFTAALLQHMGTPGQPVEQVLKRVVRSVRDDTQGAQVPWSEGSIDGDFYFRTAADPSAANRAAGPVLQPGLDLEDLQRQSDRERQAAANLARMTADFDKVSNFDGPVPLQIQAWERFVATWPQDRSPGVTGLTLAQRAQQRLASLRSSLAAPIAQAGGPIVVASSLTSNPALASLNFVPGYSPKNLTISEEGLYSNGIYNSGDRHPDAKGSSFVLQLASAFDKSTFAVAAEFLPEGPSQTLWMLGTSYRWFGISLRGGELVVLANNGDHELRTGLRWPDKSWSRLRVSADLKRNRVVVILGARRFEGSLPTGALPLQVTQQTAYADNAFALANYSNGNTYKGRIRQLKIVSGAADLESL